MPGPDFRGQGDILTDARVVIGTPTVSTARLHVVPTGNNPPAAVLEGSGDGPGYQARIELVDKQTGGRTWMVVSGAWSGGNFGIYDATAGDYRLFIDTDGHVGIGTFTPGERLEVNGNVKAAGKGSFGGPAGSQGAINVPAAGVYSYNTPQRYIALRSDGTGNDLESVGAVLYINFSGQPVDFLNGKVRIEAGGNLTVRGNRFYAPNIPPEDRYWFLVNGQAEPANAVLGLYSNADGTDKRVEIKGDVYVGARKAIDSQGRCLYAP